MSTERCGRCGGPVYFAEKAIANGRSWHKQCLTCRECRKRLDSTCLCNREDEIYCKACYNKSFGPKGYGYGMGAGTLSMVSGSKSETKSTAPLAPVIHHSGQHVKGGCPRCGACVYLAEKVTSAGQNWHKSCFKCACCKMMLQTTTVCDHHGEIYCRACYTRDFGPKGYGYGQGAGALTLTE